MLAIKLMHVEDPVYKELKEQPTYHQDALEVLSAVDEWLPATYTRKVTNDSVVLSRSNCRPRRTACELERV